VRGREERRCRWRGMGKIGGTDKEGGRRERWGGEKGERWRRQREGVSTSSVYFRPSGVISP